MILESLGKTENQTNNLFAEVSENTNWEDLETLAKQITDFKGTSDYLFTKKIFENKDFALQIIQRKFKNF